MKRVSKRASKKCVIIKWILAHRHSMVCNVAFVVVVVKNMLLPFIMYSVLVAGTQKHARVSRSWFAIDHLDELPAPRKREQFKVCRTILVKLGRIIDIDVDASQTGRKIHNIS